MIRVLLLTLVVIAPLPALAEEVAYVDQVWQVLAPVPGGATADAVAARARQTAPSVEVATAEVDTTVARNRQTLSRYVPRLITQASYLRKNGVTYDFSAGGASVGAANAGGLQVGGCPGGAGTNCVLDSAGLPVQAVIAPPFVIPQNNYAVQVDLSVPFSDYALALWPAKKAANADENAARLRRQAEIDTVDVNARIAFYDWLRSQAQMAVAGRSLASAEARLADAQMGTRAGTMTSADALGVESLVAASRTALAQAESYSRLAVQRLMITTQWQGPLNVGEDLSQPPPDVATLGNVESLISQGQENRPEIRALHSATSASEYAEDGLLASMLPRLDGVANVTHANPNPVFFPPSQVWNTSWFFGLTLRWQLDAFIAARSQSKELSANTRLLRAQHTSILRAIELEVRAAWEDWQRASDSARLSTLEIQSTEAMYAQRLALFRGGEATSTDIQDAEVQRHNATMRLVSARIDQRIAFARLRRAAGLSQEPTK